MKISSDNETINALSLSVDEVAIVFSFLPPTDILRARACTTWKDAAKKTTIPCPLRVFDESSYNLMKVMATVLPNLQQLLIDDLDDLDDEDDEDEDGHKFSDGEDPDEEIAEETADYHTYDINVISNFSKLKDLRLSFSPLNGSYPVLFNFPCLQLLEISECFNLKWDLNMLSGCPQLRRLIVYMWYGRDEPTGDLRSLRVLRNTLEELELSNCYEVSGDMIELADFPYLKKLDLWGTSITGDIRNIGRDDFPSIKTEFLLPPTVVGGCDYEFQRISDVPSFMESILPLLKCEHIFDAYFYRFTLNWRLSRDSPDWYASMNNGDDDNFPEPPFIISFVTLRSRLGWRWGDGHDEYDDEWVSMISMTLTMRMTKTKTDTNFPMVKIQMKR